MRIQPATAIVTFSRTQHTASSKSPWSAKEIEAFAELGLNPPKVAKTNHWAFIAGFIADLAFAMIVGIGVVLASAAIFGTLPVLLMPCLIIGGASAAVFVISALAKEIIDRCSK